MNKIAIFSFFSFLILFSCREKDPFIRLNGSTQGTSYSIICERKHGLNERKLNRGISDILTRIDNSLSVYNNSSLISRINRNEDVSADRYFTEVFNLSREISDMTGGAFDITVGPLVRAWGFGPEERAKFDTTKLDSLKQLVGYRKVKLENGRVIKERPEIMLDVNAIAQGYTVDVIGRYFDSLGVENYLIEVGGEVKVKGTKGGRLWRLGIDRPYENNLFPGADLQAVIELKDRALATSGNYRKFYEENGVKFSHTIDPHTGYPARSRLLSATILSKECAVADAVATASMVMGLEKTIEFLESHPEFEAFLIYSDSSGYFRTWASKTLKASITEEN